MVLLWSMAQAADLRIYPGFAEVREPTGTAEGQYTFSIDQQDLCQVFPSSIGIQNTRVQSYLVTTRTVPWLSQLVGQRVALKNYASTVVPVIVVRVEGQNILVQDEVTQRYFVTSASNLEFFELPETFQDRTEVNYQFQLTGTKPAELQYLTRAVTWKPLYVLDVQGDQATLKGWAEISNQGSKQIRVDHVELFGGEVNRPAQTFPGCGGVTPQAFYQKSSMAFEGMLDKSSLDDVVVSVPESAAGGIYRFQVDALFEVPSKATHALPLQESSISDVHRVLTRHQPFSFNNQNGLLNREYRLKAPEFLLASQLTVRDEDVFMGETTISNTAKNKDLSINMGSAPETSFDRTVQLLSQDRISAETRDIRRETYLVTVILKNLKDAAVEVEYQENMNLSGRTWKVLKQEPELVKGNTFGYRGMLQAGEEKTLQFTLQTERPW